MTSKAITAECGGYTYEFATKGDATGWRESARAALARGEKIQKPVFMEELFLRDLDVRAASMTPQNVRRKRRVWEVWLAPHFAKRLISGITRKDVEAWVRWVKSKDGTADRMGPAVAESVATLISQIKRRAKSERLAVSDAWYWNW